MEFMKDNYNILLMNIGARHRKIATLQVGSIVGLYVFLAESKKRNIIAIEAKAKEWTVRSS